MKFLSKRLTSGHLWHRPTVLQLPKVRSFHFHSKNERMKMLKWPCMVFIGSGYSEDQGAVGGAGVEDDMNTLHLDEENEQPPLILETD